MGWVEKGKEVSFVNHGRIIVVRYAASASNQEECEAFKKEAEEYGLKVLLLSYHGVGAMEKPELDLIELK